VQALRDWLAIAGTVAAAFFFQWRIAGKIANWQREIDEIESLRSEVDRLTVQVAILLERTKGRSE